MDNVTFAATRMIEAHREAFERYYEMLVSWNEKMNLTAITERQEVYVKHFADSLLVCEMPEWQGVLTKECRVVDIGTGAGFPGLPLAVCFPEVKFVLCDALQKRVTFLQTVASELGLQNVDMVHGRAEDLAQDRRYRNQFDVVVSRAVARLNVLAELTMPFARIGGLVLAFKGPSVQEEISDGKRAAGQLGGELSRVEDFQLPNDQGDRSIVVFQQKSATPKPFPRKAGTPQRKPL